MRNRDDEYLDELWGGIIPVEEGGSSGETLPPGTPPADVYRPGSDPPQWAWEQQQGLPESGPGGMTPPDIYRDWPGQAPAPTGGGDGGYSYGGGGGGGAYGFGNAPQLSYPDWISAGEFVAPERQGIGAFKPRTANFDLNPFKASDWGDAENEPGYVAARGNLRKQIEAGAAHRGMVRSGMTIGDLYSNLDALSQQNFKQFDDRRFRNYQSDEGGRLTKFQQEYGIDRDVYDRYAADIESGNNYRYGAAKDTYGFHAADVDRGNNYRFNAADGAFRDALERWKTQVNALVSMSRPVD